MADHTTTVPAVVQDRSSKPLIQNSTEENLQCSFQDCTYRILRSGDECHKKFTMRYNFSLLARN